MGGGAGADNFVWTHLNEAPNDGMGNIDWIHDFNPLQNDKIDLSAVAHELGKDHLVFVGDESMYPTAGSVAGSVYYSVGSAHDYVIHVADGSGVDHWAMDIGVTTASGTPDTSWFHL